MSHRGQILMHKDFVGLPLIGTYFNSIGAPLQYTQPLRQDSLLNCIYSRDHAREKKTTSWADFYTFPNAVTNLVYLDVPLIFLTRMQAVN